MENIVRRKDLYFRKDNAFSVFDYGSFDDEMVNVQAGTEKLHVSGNGRDSF